MANILSRFILFLGSYIPLWAIFFIMTLREHHYAAYCFGFLAILSLLGTIIFLKMVQNMQGISLTVHSIRRQDSEIMSYIASYVIPFATTDLGKIEQVASLSIFLSVLCLVYINSSMIHINPLLSIMRYHLFEVEDNNGESYFFITKRRVRRGETVRAIDIADGIFVEKI